MESGNRLKFKKFLRYLKNWYFDDTARFHYSLWNGPQQVLVYGDCDTSTNSSEAINRWPNNDCPSLRTKESIFQRVYRSKFEQVEKYVDRVQNNRMPKRRHIQCERNEKLTDLCQCFDALSIEEKCIKYLHYLRCYSNLDLYSPSYDTE